MKSEDIKQTITIKTEHIDRKTFLGLRDLITKYYFQFSHVTEDNGEFGFMYVITLHINLRSIEEMFYFNKELQEILL